MIVNKNKISFKISEVIDNEETFSIVLDEKEAEDFIAIWKYSNLDFAPISIEKINTGYTATLKDISALRKMTEYLSEVFIIDKRS